MLARPANRVKEFTLTTGTSTITLAGASPGYQTFAAAGLVEGDIVTYLIEDSNNSWELGIGILGSGGTLIRDASAGRESSDSGNLLNLSGGATVSYVFSKEQVEEITSDAWFFSHASR